MKECFEKEMRTRPQSSRQSVSVIFGMAAAGVSRGQTNGLSNFGQKARSDYSFKRNENGPGRGAVFLGRDRGRDGWRLAHYRPIKIHHSHNAHSASRFRDSPTPGRCAGCGRAVLGNQSCMASTQAGLGRRSTLAARCRLGSTVATLAPRRTPYIWRFSMTRCT